MRVIGTVIPLRERIRRAWKALRTRIEPEDYDSGGWTSSSTTKWATTDEPNAETKTAIEEAISGEGCRYFDSLDDLYRDLEKP